MFDQGNYASPLPLAPVVGRRRTRAIAQLEQVERRERFKRAAVEKNPRTTDNNLSNANAENVNVNTNTSSTSATSIRRTRTTYNSILSSASLSARTQVTPASGEATASVRPKVVIGSSVEDELPTRTVLECTPTKKELQSPPQIRRMKPAPQVTVPTPEKVVPASIGIEVAEPASVPAAAAAANANSDDAGANSETASSAQNNEIPMVKPKRVPARGIAQSSSSFSNRKRMISFSPERDERPENRALALLKLQKNLKATEKLQQRLEGVGVMLKNEEQPRSAFTTPSKDQSQRPVASSRMLQSPVVNFNPLVTPVKCATTPLRYETPSAVNSQTLEFESDNEGNIEAQCAGQQQFQENPVTPVKPTPATPQTLQTPGKITGKTENDTSAESVAPAAAASQEEDQAPTQELNFDSQVSEPAASQMNEEGDGVGCGDTQVLSSQQSEAHLLLSCSQDTQNTNHVVDFSLASSMEFTSTSVIEDVGLFNCDVDVEYTGGVYGEGTDGKVSAAVIGGQKVALKRAKPHEGFPEEEAKRRSAIELHYLRKVRHMQGFVQCLGLCDGIEHTCIALEVMDCKLSDYLRRYGTNTGAATSGGSGPSKRRFTLSLDEAKGMLRQICLPMMLLHDQVNVAHGDLACRNILLRTPPKGYEKKWEPVVKLSDFGRIKVPSTEPKILGEGFSFYKNCDIGSFGREILYRFLVGEIVPPACLETRSLHKLLQDLVVKQIPDAAKERLGPYYRLFMRCTGWGVRPSFREIYEHLDDLEYFETTENGLFPLKPSGTASQSSSTADASFLSPVMDGSRLKFVSSGSKAKYETPNGAAQRTSNGAPRLLQSKSGTDGSIPGVGSKTVNLLKPRSVLRNTPHQMHSTTTATAASTTGNTATNAHNEKLHPRSLATSSGFTPNGRPMLLKKTPPSAGASRRSLQILSQIQHRTTEKGK